jgi:PPOX class probable F420-dependent enzyme
MTAQQRLSSSTSAPPGSVALLQDPVAQRLLQSPIPARLAYTGTDGGPRVVPLWFHWDGAAFLLDTPPTAPKVSALRRDPRVALTIDGTDFPYAVLLVRGTARLELVDGGAPEYAAAARRYFGDEQGAAWVAQMGALMPQTARIIVTPEQVTVLDLQTRFPRAVAHAMAAAQARTG